jgi:hypothetical protein
MQSLKRRNQLSPGPISGEAHIRIAWIVPVFDPRVVESRAQVRSSGSKQGADEPATPLRDPPQARKSAAAREMEQDRLDLVVGSVRREDQGIRSELVSDFIEEIVSGPPAGRLEAFTAGSGKGGHVGPAHLAWQGKRRCRIRNEGGVIGRIRS